MDSVIKSLLTLFCLCLFFFTMSGVIYASMSMKNAEGYAESVTQEISECDFSETVIDALKTNAQMVSADSNGNHTYDLVVEPLDMDNDGVLDMAYVDLKYNVKVPFFGYSSVDHHIRKIAR